MQFGKVFISSLLDISESEFYNLVKGKDIGGIDKKDAYKKWFESKPKKEKSKSFKERLSEELEKQNKEALD
jgi:hypothetical protein